MSASHLESLRSISLFEEMPADALGKLEQQCVWMHKNSGDQILARDSSSREVFFVVHGSVRIVNYSASGREVSYATIRTGDYFGELPAIDDQPRSASVVAQGACTLASVSPTVFLDILATHASVGLKALTKLARIIRICNDRIMDLTTLGAYQRVYVEILRLCAPDQATPSLWVVWPLPTQADIAARASTTRETVARVQGKLASQGIVKRKGRSLYILDKPELENLAEGVNSML